MQASVYQSRLQYPAVQYSAVVMMPFSGAAKHASYLQLDIVHRLHVSRPKVLDTPKQKEQRLPALCKLDAVQKIQLIYGKLRETMFLIRWQSDKHFSTKEVRRTVCAAQGSLVSILRGSKPEQLHHTVARSRTWQGLQAVYVRTMVTAAIKCMLPIDPQVSMLTNILRSIFPGGLLPFRGCILLTGYNQPQFRLKSDHDRTHCKLSNVPSRLLSRCWVKLSRQRKKAAEAHQQAFIDKKVR